MKTKYIWLIAILLGFSACESDDDAVIVATPLPDLNAGSANFSNYVALGASIASGYADGGLFIAGQEDSYPQRLAEQFANVGGGAFTQPLMNDNTGGILVGGVPVTAYRFIFNGDAPQRLNEFLESLGAPVPPITTEAGVNLGSTFNNMAIPGAKSFHLTFPGYGALNPYYARIATSAGATVLGDAVIQDPSFFTMSDIGGNDVLAYATSGGIGVNQLGNFNPATYGFNDITDPTVFGQVFTGIVDQLTANGAQGVLVNIPYVTQLPYFTTVPHNIIPLDAATAGAVNGAYAAYNGGLQAALGGGLIDEAEAEARTISFEAIDDNAVVIVDEDLTDLSGLGLPNYRQATENDFMTLPGISFIGTEAVPGNPLTVNGVAIPLGDQWVLTEAEVSAVITATDAYNDVIASVAQSNGLAFFDFKALADEAVISGLSAGNYTLTTDFVTGGLVSLDGVHLTAKGYVVMANEIMKAIDATYGSNFEASGSLIDVESYNSHYSAMLQ